MAVGRRRRNAIGALLALGGTLALMSGSTAVAQISGPTFSDFVDFNGTLYPTSHNRAVLVVRPQNCSLISNDESNGPRLGCLVVAHITVSNLTTTPVFTGSFRAVGLPSAAEPRVERFQGSFNSSTNDPCGFPTGFTTFGGSGTETDEAGTVNAGFVVSAASITGRTVDLEAEVYDNPSGAPGVFDMDQCL